VATILVLAKDEDDLPVVALRIRAAREFSAPCALEPRDVLVVQDDAVVPAARAALEAVEVDDARRRRMNRVANHALADDRVAIVRNAQIGEPGERPTPGEHVFRPPEVEDRPPSQIVLVAPPRPRKDKASFARRRPDERVTSGAHPCGCQPAMRPRVVSDDRPSDAHRACPIYNVPMQAMVIREPGDPRSLELRSVATPQPVRGEVRVRVHATAVNRADLLFVRGRYVLSADATPGVPGLEIAGVVDAVGEGVTEHAVGHRVFGVVGGGGFAEYVVVHARRLARIPDTLTFPDAAAVPEVFTTAWDAMVDQARLVAGEHVLIHAAGSGVGTAAVQLARVIGAESIGTSRSADKLERARALGLREAIAVSGPSFAREVLDRTGGRGVDVVVELVGGAFVAEDIACLAARGRIVVIGTVAGGSATIDLHALMVKRASLRGTVLGGRPIEDKILAGRMLERHIVPLLENGSLRPMVDRVFPWTQAADALLLLESNATFGKVVLHIGDG
jgi:NADPH2:quinone reductase